MFLLDLQMNDFFSVCFYWTLRRTISSVLFYVPITVLGLQMNDFFSVYVPIRLINLNDFFSFNTVHLFFLDLLFYQHTIQTRNETCTNLMSANQKGPYFSRIADGKNKGKCMLQCCKQYVNTEKESGRKRGMI